MRLSEVDGEIAHDLEEFLNDYRDPCGRPFIFEVTCNAVTYVYADILGTVLADQVIFELNSKDPVCTHKAH